MTKFFEFLKKRPLLTAALAVVIALMGVRIPQDSFWTRCVLRILLCGTMLFLLYLISGEKTLFLGNNQTGYVLRRLLGLLIFAAVAGVLGVLGTVMNGEIVPGLPLRLVTVMLMFLFVGLFEELCFRAILNDAMIYRFRNSRGVFAVSAVVSSLIFGVMHVIGSPLTDPSAFVQAALKTLSTAIAGFAFLILYWKTRNVWAIGLAHGMYDFLGAPSLVLGSSAPIGAGNYVMEGVVGKAAIIVYVIQIVVSGFITLHIWKKVGKTIDFKAIRENW